MTDKISPEKLLVVKIGAWIHTSGYVDFDVDTTPYPEDLSEVLIDHLKVRCNNWKDLIREYEASAQSLLDEKRAETAGVPDIGSAFDIQLSRPTYVIYVTALRNWFFRAENQNQAMTPKGSLNTEFFDQVEHIDSISGNHDFGVENNQITMYGINVKTALPERKGGGFDINVSVFQPDNNNIQRETKIIIDPRIGNP